MKKYFQAQVCRWRLEQCVLQTGDQRRVWGTLFRGKWITTRHRARGGPRQPGLFQSHVRYEWGSTIHGWSTGGGYGRVDPELRVDARRPRISVYGSRATTRIVPGLHRHGQRYSVPRGRRQRVLDFQASDWSTENFLASDWSIQINILEARVLFHLFGLLYTFVILSDKQTQISSWTSGHLKL